jgi:hypothetical protein
MSNKVRPSGIEIFLSTIIISIITCIFTSLFFYFKEVNKRKLWKEFFLTFTPLVMLNYGYYAFINPFNLNTINFLLYTSISFIVCWILCFLFYSPVYYKKEWVTEEYWRTLDSYEFEEEIANLFRGMGYKAKVTQKSVDYGVDVIVWVKNRKRVVKTAVQCKRYNRHPATCSEVRDLWGSKDYYNCEGAIMVALDGVTKQGQQFISKFENYSFMTIDDIIKNAAQVQKEE